MITCPVCGQSQLLGSVICQNCGGQISINNNNALERENLKFSSNTSLQDFSSTSKMKTWVSLYNLECGEIIPLPDDDEITIGRSSEDQQVPPDCDLSRFNAFENGVSRFHCVLKRIKKQAMISDLGSSNGTFLNGSRLPEHKETPIRHGDILILGKLKFQLLLY